MRVLCKKKSISKRTVIQLHCYCSNTSSPALNQSTLPKTHWTPHLNVSKSAEEAKCARAFVQRTGINCDQSLRSCDRVNISNQNVQPFVHTLIVYRLLYTRFTCYTFLRFFSFLCVFFFRVLFRATNNQKFFFWFRCINSKKLAETIGRQFCFVVQLVNKCAIFS